MLFWPVNKFTAYSTPYDFNHNPTNPFSSWFIIHGRSERSWKEGPLRTAFGEVVVFEVLVCLSASKRNQYNEEICFVFVMAYEKYFSLSLWL